jgi:hypothetical protein
MIFDVKHHFETPLLALFEKIAKLGKVPGDTYNQGRWLLNEWVAEGVASDPHDFTKQPE